jgi:hypothetical protein
MEAPKNIKKWNWNDNQISGSDDKNWEFRHGKKPKNGVQPSKVLKRQLDLVSEPRW